jgi:hypothetical protein
MVKKLVRKKLTNILMITKNDYTCAIDFFDVEMESFLGYEAPKSNHIKPLTALSKLANNEISEEKIQDLKEKITNLLQKKD